MGVSLFTFHKSNPYVVSISRKQSGDTIAITCKPTTFATAIITIPSLEKILSYFPCFLTLIAPPVMVVLQTFWHVIPEFHSSVPSQQSDLCQLLVKHSISTPQIRSFTIELNNSLPWVDSAQ